MCRIEFSGSTCRTFAITVCEKFVAFVKSISHAKSTIGFEAATAITGKMIMPFLKIQTNKAINEEKSQPLLRKASQLIAQELNKPEQYMMVSVETDRLMMFAGSTGPTAFVELKAIGLPIAKTSELSRLLCELIGSELGVAEERIYINFVDVPANLWGWN